MTGIDHGELNLPLKKRQAGMQRELDAWRAEQRRQNKADAQAAHERRLAAREAEAARPNLTADDVRGHVAVRDEHGWHRIVRVNAKSVTVQTPYSWTDRIALDKVLEVRS